MKKFLLAAFLLVTPVLAQAAEKEEQLALKYEAHWSGFKAGEVKLYFGENNKDYKFTANVESYGILRRLTNYWSRNFVTGKVSKLGYEPENYNSKWQRKKKIEQQVVVDYADSGKKVEVTATPPMKQKKRTPVEQDRIGTLDPISAGYTARKKVREIMEGAKPLPQEFTLPVYDGTRVFDVKLVVKGYQTKTIAGHSQKLLHIFLSRKPVAGFSPKELDIENRDAPVFDVYVNDNYIPVWAVGTAPMGTATITLAKTCTTIDGCEL